MVTKRPDANHAAPLGHLGHQAEPGLNPARRCRRVLGRRPGPADDRRTDPAVPGAVACPWARSLRCLPPCARGQRPVRWRPGWPLPCPAGASHRAWLSGAGVLRCRPRRPDEGPARQGPWSLARARVTGWTERDRGPQADAEQRTRSAHRAIEIREKRRGVLSSHPAWITWAAAGACECALSVS
jgi:hypothetical protein